MRRLAPAYLFCPYVMFGTSRHLDKTAASGVGREGVTRQAGSREAVLYWNMRQRWMYIYTWCFIRGLEAHYYLGLRLSVDTRE